jgi:hypothetical protein
VQFAVLKDEVLGGSLTTLYANRISHYGAVPGTVSKLTFQH